VGDQTANKIREGEWREKVREGVPVFPSSPTPKRASGGGKELMELWELTAGSRAIRSVA